MVKSKNHTNHNQSAKNHRNGIKNIPKNKYQSQVGVNTMLRKNTRRARKFDPSVKFDVNTEKRISHLRENKQKILDAIKARIEKQKEKKLKKKEKKKSKGKKKKKKKKKN